MRRFSRAVAAAAVVASSLLGVAPGVGAVTTTTSWRAVGPSMARGFTEGSAAPVEHASAVSPGAGYDFVAADGGIFSYDAPYAGSMGGKPLSAPIVGMAPTADGGGYWLVGSDGGIFAFGDAAFHGSTGSLRLAQPIVGMAADPVTGGYWFVAADGGIFAYGAPYFGSMGGKPLSAPIVGMAPTADGGGYWLVARDGGIFAFGDAAFEGSAGSLHLAQPIVGMAADPATGGYWFVAADGGIFGYNAPYVGSMGGRHLSAPIVGMATTPDGGGYWLVARDGGIFAFGDAAFHGSTGSLHLAKPIVGMAAFAAPTVLPAAVVSVAYSVTLPAPAGTAPFHWAVTAGSLPGGLTLNPSTGALSGQPTTVEDAAFTVTVTDSSPAHKATAEKYLLTVDNGSINWAGYVVLDSTAPIKGAEGTFTVPSIDTSDPSRAVSQWVGIGGYAQGDQSLIQAGAVEYPVPGGGFQAYAWTEVLPDPAVNKYPVQPGDSITVRIVEVGQDLWQIDLDDTTSGGSYSHTYSYSDPGISAEWILEAPTSGSTGQTNLAPFSPDVEFTNLAIDQTADENDRLAMVQGSNQVVASPSAIDSTGFAVAYGDTPPPAP